VTSLQVGVAPGEGTVEWMTRATASSGRIYFWQGGSLWIGAGRGRTQWHAHHAHQIALAPQGQFRFRTENGGAWTDFEAALVPSHRTHQFELDGMPIAHLFVEPESRAGRVLAARFGSDEVAALPAADTQPLARALFKAFAADASRGAMVPAAERALAALCGSASEAEAEAARAMDPRLERALAFMRQHLRRPISLAEVAAAAALSESRFRHLFVAQTGSSFRAYLLWLRINLAIESVMAGASWTEAAHEAGFADSAHLTRTHKRMFGIEPSAVRPLPETRADA
jgi:AraC family transcriptional regulator